MLHFGPSVYINFITKLTNLGSKYLIQILLQINGIN